MAQSAAFDRVLQLACQAGAAFLHSLTFVFGRQSFAGSGKSLPPPAAGAVLPRLEKTGIQGG